MKAHAMTRKPYGLRLRTTPGAPAIAMALLMLASSPSALAVGQVEVRFAPQDQLSDIGRGVDGERNLQTLDAHVRSLAGRLPDSHALSIEVQDVDLAGELRPWPHGTEMRVLNGRADGPAFELRWTLTRNGQSVSSGSDRLIDLAYLMRPLPARHQGPLAYETRLIDRWFDERFGPAAPR